MQLPQTPPTGTVEACVSAIGMMRSTPYPVWNEGVSPLCAPSEEVFRLRGNRQRVDDLRSWPINKAVVRVEDLDGKCLGLHMFNTNQEAVDLLMSCNNKPMNVTFKAIGMDVNSFMKLPSKVDRSNVLDIL
jgi:hypothetical protein